MTANSLFTGFAGFSEAPLPEGAMKLQYGLSTQVIQIEAEATVAPDTGVTPRQLAEKYARMFNMPTDGLVVYADGVEISFGEPIPTTARVLEFRQPSGEKGSGRLVRVFGDPKMVPLGEHTVTVCVYRRDTVNFTAVRTELYGAMGMGLEPWVSLKEGVEVLHRQDGQIYIGRRITETKATRPVFVFEVEMTRTAGKYDLGDVFKAFPGAEVRVNGKVPAEDRLEPGDLVEIVVPGETRTADFEAWTAEMRQLAIGHWGEALENRANSIAVRRAELESEPWATIRSIAKNTWEILTGGKGRTKETLIDEILEKEFVWAKSQDEFVRQWLVENAPEVLEA